MRLKASDPGALDHEVIDLESGKPIELVVEADDDQGWFKRYVKQDHPPYGLVKRLNGDPLTETVHQKIAIKRIERKLSDRLTDFLEYVDELIAERHHYDMSEGHYEAIREARDLLREQGR